METLRTKYLGGFSTEVEHLKSGATIITDSPADVHQKREVFSPTDLLAASYGCCVLTVIATAAQTHGFNIEGAEMKTTKIMASDPRRIAELIVELTLPHNSYTDKERKIIELSAKHCPVANSLDPAMKITKTIIYKD